MFIVQMGFKTSGIKINTALEQVSTAILTKLPTNPNTLNDERSPNDDSQ